MRAWGKRHSRPNLGGSQFVEQLGEELSHGHDPIAAISVPPAEDEPVIHIAEVRI
jgi:hypothetical protein